MHSCLKRNIWKANGLRKSQEQYVAAMFVSVHVKVALQQFVYLARSTTFYSLIWCDEKSAHNLQHENVDKIFSFKEENYPSRNIFIPL